MTDNKELSVPEQPGMQLGIIPARTPHDVIVQATAIAKELATIVRENHLANPIQGKNFVRVEGWSTMGAMIGILPREIPELGKRFDDGSYEAAVELIRISDGAVVGRASALVGMDEKDKLGKLTWGSRSEFARKSMAITRATGKAYRLGFSWIMALAGYEATPAEEIVEGEYHEAPASNGNGKTIPTPTTQQPKQTNGNLTLDKHLVNLKIAQNIHEAREILKKFGVDATDLTIPANPEEIIKMCKGYRGWRDMGATSEQAVKSIKAGEYPK